VTSDYKLTRDELRALERRVARLPVAEADAVVDRAVGSPVWARQNGWTTRPPVDTVEDDAARRGVEVTLAGQPVDVVQIVADLRKSERGRAALRRRGLS
jgi:hypothetical protein